MSEGARARAAWTAAIALALLAFALATAVNARTSATWDEPVYLAAGVSYWRKADYRLNREAPPLPAALGGLAALSLGPSFPDADPSWAAGDEWKLASAFERENDAIARALSFRARLPIAALGALGVIVVFAWARRLGGDLAGVAAAALAALSPEWLAHSAVLSADVAVSVFMALSIARATAIASSAREPGWREAVSLGALIFLGLASKFTGLILLALVPGAVFGVVALRRRAGLATAPPRSLAKLIPRAFAVVAVLGALVLYPGELGFAGYVKGMTLVYKNVDPDTRFFLCGRYSDHGWPWYALACILLKSTLGLLVLSAIGFGVAAKRLAREPELLGPLLLLAAILGASLFDRAAFGLRRVLPAYPALFVLSGVAVAVLGERARRAGVAVAVALVLAHAGSSLRAFPDCIPYFNEIALGAADRTDLLTDSNLDWGQALPELARAIEERHPARVKLAYYGHADPHRYGVAAERLGLEDLLAPEPGVLYAVSASLLVTTRGEVREGKKPAAADWLSRARPVGRAGEAIYLYEWPLSGRQ